MEFPFVAIFGRAKVHDLASFIKLRRWMAAVGIQQKQRLLISPRENDDAKEIELFVEAHANIAGTCVSQGSTEVSTPTQCTATSLLSGNLYARRKLKTVSTTFL